MRRWNTAAAAPRSIQRSFATQLFLHHLSAANTQTRAPVPQFMLSWERFGFIKVWSTNILDVSIMTSMNSVVTKPSGRKSCRLHAGQRFHVLEEIWLDGACLLSKAEVNTSKGNEEIRKQQVSALQHGVNHTVWIDLTGLYIYWVSPDNKTNHGHHESCVSSTHGCNAGLFQKDGLDAKSSDTHLQFQNHFHLSRVHTCPVNFQYSCKINIIEILNRPAKSVCGSFSMCT